MFFLHPISLKFLLFVICIMFFKGVGVANAGSDASSASNERLRVLGLSKSDLPPILLAKKKKKKRRISKKQKPKEEKKQTDEVFVPCLACENLEGFVHPEEIHRDIRRLIGKYKGGGGARNVKVQIERGIFETGLFSDFIGGAKCPEIDSEKWAIDYTYKRGQAALHRGVDIPQPRGTPIRAVADGTVVGRFVNEGRKDGIAVFLRHNPEQTGLTFWTYSHYTHLLEMSPLTIGTQVKMGDEIGKTSNSGKMGRRVRRDALHFAIFYSDFPEWSNDGSVVTPKDGYAMDPNAFYRANPPYDSQSMLKLSDAQKATPIPHMKTDHTFIPSDTKRIWPYPCD